MKSRVALVTGDSRGIGAVIAMVLARKGTRVLAPSRPEMDLHDPESIEHYVRAIEDPIDILVNNAGINSLAELDELDLATLNESSRELMLGRFGHRLQADCKKDAPLTIDELDTPYSENPELLKSIYDRGL